MTPLLGAALAVVARDPKAVEACRGRFAEREGLVHVTVEVRQCRARVSVIRA